MASKDQSPAKDETTPNGAVMAPNAFQKLVIKMAGLAALEETEGRISGEDIIPILEAETEEEMWDADERPRYNAKTLSGCELVIYGFAVKYGAGDEDITTPFLDPKTRRQMYVLVQAARLNKAGEKKEYRLPVPGEVFTWNTSARNIIGKLFWMLDHGWFDAGASPVNLRIEGTDLGKGKSVEKLKPLTPITVGGQATQSTESPF